MASPRLLLDLPDDVVEFTVPVILNLAVFLSPPGILLRRVKTPDYYIARAAPVIVPGRVPSAPAFAVGGATEEWVKCLLKLREEDEVVRPFVCVCGVGAAV